jgi:hypothetical protein
LTGTRFSVTVFARAVLLLCLWTLPVHAAAISTGVRVESVIGKLEAGAGGRGPWREVREGDTVAGATWLRTDAASRAVLGAGSARFALGPVTLLRCDAARVGVTHLVCPSGSVRTSVGRREAGAVYSVSTPILSIGVRGTEYALEVSEIGAALVRMETGHAEIRTGDSAIPLPAGEAVAGDPFTGIHPLTPDAAADIEAWRRVFSIAQTSPDSVTNAYRPLTFRQVAIIRATFDRVLGLYKRRAEIDAIENPEEAAVARDALRREAEDLYLAIIEGRGRLDAVAEVIEHMKTLRGSPAPWVDEAIVGYRNIWDGWLEMNRAFLDSLGEP